MNEEIKKLIEEEAEKCAININYRNLPEYLDVMHLIESFKEGANFIHSKWQEANRWRKVSEELPEVRDESYQILIRIPNIKLSATAWSIRNQSDCDIIAKMGNSEWKPIS